MPAFEMPRCSQVALEKHHGFLFRRKLSSKYAYTRKAATLCVKDSHNLSANPHSFLSHFLKPIPLLFLTFKSSVQLPFSLSFLFFLCFHWYAAKYLTECSRKKEQERMEEGREVERKKKKGKEEERKEEK